MSLRTLRLLHKNLPTYNPLRDVLRGIMVLRDVLRGVVVLRDVLCGIVVLQDVLRGVLRGVVVLRDVVYYANLQSGSTWRSPPSRCWPPCGRRCPCWYGSPGWQFEKKVVKYSVLFSLSNSDRQTVKKDSNSFLSEPALSNEVSLARSGFTHRISYIFAKPRIYIKDWIRNPNFSYI